MVFKTWLSDINKVALALDSLNGIIQLKTGSTIANGMKLSEVAVNEYKASIEGLSLSQAQVALSTTALNDAQKEQILISAGLLKTTDSITASEIKQTVTENILTAEKQQEILATFELEMAEGKLTWERLEAIATEDSEAGAIARLIIAKKGENAQNLKNIASGKALTAVLKEQLLALATNPMTWVVAGLAGVATVAYQCSQAIEEVKAKAQELNETFSTSKTEIEDYKTQIDDLHKTINDSGSSIEDVTAARQNLMSIQDQLIEKFGDEKDTIDLITDAINGQTDALNTLTEAQWQATKNEFNESGFWNDVANGIDGYSNNIDRMLGEYEGYSVTIDMSEYGGTLFTEGYDEFKQMLKDDFGATISESSTAALELSGSASEVRQKLLDIQEILKENSTYKPDDTFSDYLGGLERSADDVIEKYEDFYKQYVLYEEIFTNDIFTDSYKKINDAYSEYKDAFATGNEESIKKAQDNFANILTQATEGVSDESVVDFFNGMYPDLQEVVGNWQFETNFTANTDGLKDDVSGHLSGLDGLYSYDLKNFNYDTVTEEQKASYDGLISVARLYSLTIDQLIDKLALMGLVQDENYQKLVDLFGQNAVDKLTPEDLEIAYTISSEEADKALEQEKNKIKSELESLSKEGNVDLTIRPVIDSSAMQAAGWDVEDGSIATTFSQGEFIWQGDEENGQYVYVHYTPILPDGTVLTPDELTDYLYGTLEGSQSVLDADNKGIVLKVDTDLNIPEGDIKKFTNGEGSTDAIDGLIQKTGEWDDKVHGVQEQYYDTGEGIGYASNALDGLIKKHKQLENPDKITDSFLSYTNALGETISVTKEEFEKTFNLGDENNPFDGAVNSAKEYATVLDSLAGRINAVSDALDEQNKNGSISAQTALSLIEVDESYAKALEFTEEGIRLNTEATKDLTLAKIDLALSEAVTTLKAAQTAAQDKKIAHISADAIRGLIGRLEESGNVDPKTIEQYEAAILAEQEKWKEADQASATDIEAQQGYIDALEELKKSYSTTPTGSKSSLVLDKDDTIYNWENAWLQQKQKELDKLNSELEKLDKQFQKAIELGDEELIKTLQQSKLKKEQEIQSWTADIAKQGRASSTMVLSQLYEIAPELTGKTIDEISEQEILAVQQRLKQALVEQNNIKAKMEYDNPDISNANQANIEKAQADIDLVEEYFSTLKEYNEAFGGISGEGTFSEVWAEQNDYMVQDTQDAFDATNAIFDKAINEQQRKLGVLDLNIDLLDENDFKSQMKLIAQQMDINNHMAELYTAELEKIEKEYSQGLIADTQEYSDRLEELTDAYQDTIVAGKDYSDTLKDIAQTQLD